MYLRANLYATMSALKMGHGRDLPALENQSLVHWQEIVTTVLLISMSSRAVYNHNPLLVVIDQSLSVTNHACSQDAISI